MYALRELLDGHAVKFHGDFVDLEVDPPRARTVSGRSPLFYFGGLSPDARECAAAGADVFLMWPDTTSSRCSRSRPTWMPAPRPRAGPSATAGART